MLRKILIVAAVLSLMLLAAGTALAADATKGKTLWEQKNCKSCHGALGEGKYAGARVADARSEADWIKQARTPRANMPAYSVAQVSDADIADMLAYMKSLQPTVTVIPAAYQPTPGELPGKTLYNQKRCVACHGADPSGFIKTRFTDKARTVTAADVIKQLRTPAANMPMFSVTQVTDEQASQIADYFKSLVPAAAAAAPAALPKTGDQIPLATFAFAGLALLLVGAGVRVFVRR